MVEGKLNKRREEMTMLHKLTFKTVMGSIWSVLKVSVLACVGVVAIFVLITASIIRQIFYSTYPR